MLLWQRSSRAIGKTGAVFFSSFSSFSSFLTVMGKMPAEALFFCWSFYFGPGYGVSLTAYSPLQQKGDGDTGYSILRVAYTSNYCGLQRLGKHSTKRTAYIPLLTDNEHHFFPFFSFHPDMLYLMPTQNLYGLARQNKGATGQANLERPRVP